MSHKRMKIPEALKGAHRAAQEAGWSVTWTGGGHLKWAPPGGMPVFTPGTPRSGKRSVGNTLASLRRAGLPC